MGGAVDQAERIARSLGALFVESQTPALVLRREGALVSANRAAVAFYGYALGELVEMKLHDLVIDSASVDPELRAIGGEQHAPRLHRRKDGSHAWIAPSASCVEACGEPLIVSFMNDVTALVEAEQRARASAETVLRDRQLVINTVVAMLGEPQLEPALQLLARAFAQAVGTATTVWLPESEGSRSLKLVASYELATVGARIPEALRIHLDRERLGLRAWESGTAQIVTPATALEGSVEHQTVSRVAEEAIVAPLMGRSGAHGLIYGLVRNSEDTARLVTTATTLGTFGGMIFEAVQLEARAKRDAQRAQVMWQSASERLSDGISLLDGELRIVRVNSAERALLGLEEDMILGRPCSDILAICRGQARCPHRVALEEQRRIVLEMHGPQTGKPLRIEIIPALPNDTNIAIVHVVHDLTEERAIRTQLVTTDRLATIGRLAAGVAHEINNPAAFVMVNLGVLRERFVAGTVRTQDVLAMLDESLNGMDRIREIVRDLKGFARERSLDVVDIAHVAQSAIRMAAHETRGRARVERTADEGTVARVRGARIAQVILNLVVNAAQAIPPGRPLENRIAVRTRRLGEIVRVEVADTGPGVDPAIAERIFEPFFTTRERSGGTGLGLWLARGIVEEEGGTLTFHDEPDGGACFVVELPAASAEAVSESRPRDSVRLRAQ